LKYLLLAFILIKSLSLYSSNYIGQLLDTDTGKPIEFAEIGLLSLPDSLVVGSGKSDTQGNFLIKSQYNGTSLLSVRVPGYESPDLVKTSKDGITYGIIRLNKIEAEVEAITIQGKAATGQLLGDTVQFNSQAFKTNPDADASDLVKKLPGVSDDGTGLKAQGEEVKRVLVDGKEFFGDDPNAALKNIPAEAVQNVQIYDRNSDNAEFTGVDDGESEKTINLKLKEEYKVGAFGNIGMGYGTENRYSTNGSVNYFNDKARVSLLGNFNNLNRQNFTTEDLSGVASSQISGGGGRRRYSYSNTSEFMVGGQEGITSTLASGLNYIDEWTEKSEISLSYLFSDMGNDLSTTQNIEYIGPDVNGDFFDNQQISASDNLNHRLSGRMKFPIDTNNTILFIPRFSWQGGDSDFRQDGSYFSNNGLSDQYTSNQNISDNTGVNFNSTLLLQHKFETKGRTIQADIQTVYRENNATNAFINQFGDDPALILREDIQTQDINNSTRNIELEIDYTEPLFEDFLLTFEANSEYELSDVAQITIDRSQANPITLSNQSADLDVAYNRYGWETGFRYGKKDFTLSVTGEYRRTDMENTFTLPQSNTITRTFEAFTPRVFFRYNSEGHGIRLFARRRNSLPTASQLNDAVDNSNPLAIRQGNNLLDQEMDHFLWTSYNYFDTESNFNFYTQINANYTENVIGNVTQVFNNDTSLASGLNVGAGTQFSTYRNLTNSFAVGTSIGTGKQLEWLKSNLNFSLNYNIAETPSIINGSTNINTNSTYGGRFALVSNISEDVDFNIGYSPGYTVTANSSADVQNSNFWRNTLNGSLNLLFWDGFVLRSDINFTSLNGLGEGFDQAYTLWNGSFGYKFLENDAAEISLYVFDILGQNQSISRNITETLITDQSNNTLTQYFMLNFSYRIRNTMGGGSGQNNRPYPRRRA